MSNNEKETEIKNKNAETAPVRSVKQAKQPAKKAKQKAKKPKRNLTKEVISELKKVSWPSFSKVVKQTSVVIAVVLVFTLVLLGFDKLFSIFYDILIKLNI